MNRPPLIMRLRILDNNRNVRLWLPIFLLYPILLVPLALIAGLLLWPWGWGKALLLSIPCFFRVICALRELEVDIQKRQEILFVSFK